MRRLVLFAAVLAALAIPAVAQARWEPVFYRHAGDVTCQNLCTGVSTAYAVLPGVAVIGEQTATRSLWMLCTDPAVYRVRLVKRPGYHFVTIASRTVKCGRSTHQWFELFSGVSPDLTPANPVRVLVSETLR